MNVFINQIGGGQFFGGMMEALYVGNTIFFFLVFILFVINHYIMGKMDDPSNESLLAVFWFFCLAIFFILSAVIAVINTVRYWL